MKVCPKCLEKYEDDSRDFCTRDGARLIDKERYDKGVRDSMIGRTVAGRFPIVKRIDSGGMGTVYEAKQLPVGRPVALKVLKEELSANPLLVKRFEREAKAVSRLQNPHTVTLYDFGQDDDGLLFLAMELLEGETMSQRIDSDGALPWREALGITQQANDSLIEAHEKGIVHRDLKPDNLFLTSVSGKTHVKVLDFGIARLSQQEDGPQAVVTQTGAIFGTPGYMSPEQATGNPVDHRTDIYSLGVILYESLCGRPPFQADSAVMLMGKHISSRVPSFATRAPGIEIPDGVERLVLHMLEKNPDERVQTVVEISERITTLLASDGLDKASSDPESDDDEAPDDVVSPSIPAARTQQRMPAGVVKTAIGLAFVLLGFLAYQAISWESTPPTESPDIVASEGDGSPTDATASHVDAAEPMHDGDAAPSAAEADIEGRTTPVLDGGDSSDARVEDSRPATKARVVPRNKGRDRPGRGRNGAKRPDRDNGEGSGGSPLEIDHSPLTRKGNARRKPAPKSREGYE